MEKDSAAEFLSYIPMANDNPNVGMQLAIKTARTRSTQRLIDQWKEDGLRRMILQVRFLNITESYMICHLVFINVDFPIAKKF